MCKMKVMERPFNRETSEQINTFDIGTFVISCHRLQNKLEPFLAVVRIIAYLRRWESPTLSLILLITSIAVNEWSSVHLVLLVLFIWFPVLLVTGFKRLGTNRNWRPQSRMHLVCRKGEKASLESKRSVTLKAQIHMQEYIYILNKIQLMMEEVTKWMESFISLITWEKWKLTVLFLLSIIGTMTCVYYIPQRHLISIGVLIFFVVNKYFFKILKRIRNWLASLLWRNVYSKLIKFLSLDDEVISYTLRESKSISGNWFDTEGDMEGSVSSEGRQDDYEYEYEYDDQETEDTPRGKKDTSRSFLTQWTDFRRRRKQLSSGNCTSCNVAFSTILKKRQYCRHCGSGFCSKCCSNKVTRATLGATAPAAYEETVLVCKSCYGYLKSVGEIEGEKTEIC